MVSSAPAPSTPADHHVLAMVPALSPSSRPSTPVATCVTAAQVAPEPSETANSMAPSTDTPADRASSRIAVRKRIAAELDGVRRQKNHCVVKKEAAEAAAALAAALPVGRRASCDGPSVPAVRLQSASPTQDPTGQVREVRSTRRRQRRKRPQ
ncbi:hypothetical protein PF011_g671 [Phytophthora fragariae]|uniref:Uncharacterized protein n=1 Tax=Phytophthora fragariae TaxID=53985 RepID=A0A6A3MFH4_9STRA|nr:hypothetical protein PF011_g671 [Phytophthora fragariae]